MLGDRKQAAAAFGRTFHRVTEIAPRSTRRVLPSRPESNVADRIDATARLNA
jgi:hypothetical protein